ncbi:MAG: DUF1127 domain-containing protein [Rhodospirillales bacterium]|nr:DUF1127 domain-containing protein [Rhodospirillales bacterium]
MGRCGATPAAAARWPVSPGAEILRLIEGYLTWRDMRRSRRMLGELDERLLSDIGIDRATAAEEARKFF